MDEKALKNILKLHSLWLDGDPKGKRADLSKADLSKSDLSGANLIWANLSKSDLSEANLSEANLSKSDLSEANLTWADLSKSDLSGAYLSEADLRRAYLFNATLPDFLIVPEIGEFEAWKKCADDVVLKILIPKDARRINPLTSRKCRASKIEVLAAYKNGEPVTGRFRNWASNKLFIRKKYSATYEVGKTYSVDDFDDDIRVECAKGIHFFMTRKEAEEW